MGILNRTNDGQPSVLVTLARTLTYLGPLPAEELLDLCFPKTAEPLEPEE